MADSLSTLTDAAIEAALASHWEEALKINDEIMKEEPNNVDALTRQAKAYLELGIPEKAEKCYNEVLKIDPYNPIALKNIKIVKIYKGNGSAKPGVSAPIISAALFLQEPGKTKIVNLLKVAEPQKLSQTFCGMKVNMVIKGKKVNITDHNDIYLGALPDDISHHLIRLVNGGNKYEILIKSIRLNALSVLIREILRGKKFKNQPSFIDGGSASSLNNDMLVHMQSGDNEDQDTDQLDEIDA